MKKFTTMLALIIALAVPVIGSPGFKEGYTSEISKQDYDAINDEEFASNNNSVKVEGLGIFYSDNKILNAWYLDVTEAAEGTINIAYKIGSKYYNVKFTINGPGMYRVGDSRGSNRIHSVKIGAFEKKPPMPKQVTSAPPVTPTPQVTSAPPVIPTLPVTPTSSVTSAPQVTSVPPVIPTLPVTPTSPVTFAPEDNRNPSEPVITYEIVDGWDPSLLDYAYNHQAHAFIFYVNKLENGVVVATNKHVEHFRVHQGMVTIRYDEGYRVRFKWDNHVMLSVKIV